VQRHFNILVPSACPHCRTELLLTLDQIHEERSIRCSLCGTTIILRPENVPEPARRPVAVHPDVYLGT